MKTAPPPPISKAKVMYLNPVGTSDYDQIFADMVTAYKLPFIEADITSLNPATVPAAMTNLEFRVYESLIIKDSVEAARYCALNGYDAMVIGCFYDPALQECREISGPVNIVAPCQASLHIASQLGNKFSVIIGMDKWEDQMRQNVYDYGYKDNLASFESVGLRVEQFHQNPDVTESKLKQAALHAVESRRAEVIILGCTLETGFYLALQDFLRGETGQFVPVIDAAIAGYRAAEYAAVLKHTAWLTSRASGMAAPPEDELKKFGLFQTSYKFGNLINVPATETATLSRVAA